MVNQNELFLKNQNLIHYVIRKYFNNYYSQVIEYDDLFQIGALGLLYVCNNYDTSFNTTFSSYAVPYIWGYISRELRSISEPIKYQRYVIDIGIKIKAKLSMTVSDESLYDETIFTYLQSYDISEYDKVGVYNYIINTQSLDKVITINNSTNTIGDFVHNKTNVENDVIEDIMYTKYINEILTNEIDRDIEIFNLYFMQNQNQLIISKKLKIAQPQISRILKRFKIKTIKLLIKYNYIDYALKYFYNEFYKPAYKNDLNENNLNTLLNKIKIFYPLSNEDILLKFNSYNNVIESINIRKHTSVSLNRIIIKAIIKLILDYKKLKDMKLNDIKKLIYNKLKLHNMLNDFLENKLNALKKYQIDKFIKFSDLLIDKNNYTLSRELIINNLCFPKIKKINRLVNLNHYKFNSNKSLNLTSKALKNDSNDIIITNNIDIRETVLSILELWKHKVKT